MPASDVTIRANFEVDGATVYTVVNPEDGGSVTGAGKYREGSTVTLVATPLTGHRFTSWEVVSGGVTLSTTTNATTTFTMPANDVVVKANFERLTYTLTVENEDGEETLTFADRAEGNALWMDNEDLSGTFGLIKLNEDGEIVSMYKDASEEPVDVLAMTYETMEAVLEEYAEEVLVTYDLNDEEDDEDDDKYSVIAYESVDFEDNKLYVTGNDDDYVARVNDDTVVVTLVYVKFSTSVTYVGG
jgi:hypothetical protein